MASALMTAAAGLRPRGPATAQPRCSQVPRHRGPPPPGARPALPHARQV